MPNLREDPRNHGTPEDGDRREPPEPASHGSKRPRDAGRGFRETADLSDAAVKLSPYERPHFCKTFDSWREYEDWRRAQTNPWNR